MMCMNLGSYYVLNTWQIFSYLTVTFSPPWYNHSATWNVLKKSDFLLNSIKSSSDSNVMCVFYFLETKLISTAGICQVCLVFL